MNVIALPNPARALPIVGLALGTTLALFYVMQMLIASDGQSILESQPLHTIEWVEVRPDVPVQEEDKLPKLVETIEEPDIELPPITDTIGTSAGDTWIAPEMDGPDQLQQYGAGDSEVMPIMLANPQYPEAAARRGLEGYVILEFTVDELGRVQDPQVLYAEPANVFNRAALRAVKRYKYKPKTVDGRGVQVPGVRQRITFELSG